MVFNPVAALVIRILLGLLFLVSGILKLPDLKGFYIIFVQYGVVKGKLARLFAYSMPFAEIIIGFFLLSGFQLPLFSVLATLMLLVSTYGVAYALYKRKKLDNCGCYGTYLKSPLNIKKLVEDIIWLLLALYLLIFYLI